MTRTGRKPKPHRLSWLAGARILALWLFLWPPGNLQAAGDGPRVHGPTPVGVNGLVLNGSSLQDSNRTFDPSLIRPLSKFDTSIANLAYMGTREVFGRHTLIMAILRGGQATRQTLLPDRRERSSSSGLADPYLGVSINLFGQPVMSRNEFQNFDTGLKVDFLVGASLPLGEYEQDSLVNLGSNRWTIRFGLPITRPFTGFRGLPGTLELIPNLRIFTENTERELKQEPLFSLEGHVTQNFTVRSWGSLGFLYDLGGKTTIEGMTTNGTQKSLALTATLGFNFSPGWVLQLRFGSSVAQNEYGLVGTLYQFKLARFF